MKKRDMITLLLIGACSYTSPAQAFTNQGTVEKKEQKNHLTGGVIVETNLSNFIHSGIDDAESRMKFGFTAGGFIDLSLSKSFSVQGELLFHYKTSDFKWDNQVGEYQYWGMEIPVYAMYHYRFSKGDCLHIGIGPYTEFGLGAKFKHNGIKSDLYAKDGTTGLPALCESNTGFGIKIGYELASGFQVNVTYKASISNQLDKNSSVVNMYPQAISIGLAYRFGK